MGFSRTVTWAAAGFGAAYVLESAWHRFIAHGQRPDPTRTGHLEHHRRASEPVPVGDEVREHGPRLVKTLTGVNAVLAPFLGLGRTVPLTVGVAAGLLAVELYHARMHRRGPRTGYEAWMWRFHWHHHAADARVNFGLTNPLLDFALGTAVVPQEVEVHDRLAPAWLRDAGGSVSGIRIRTLG